MPEGRTQPLTSRVAIVTGSSSGIGRAIAAELAGRGMSVVVTSRSADREVTTTLRPRVASSAAMARPMPEEDPVTMATRLVGGWVLPSGMLPAA